MAVFQRLFGRRPAPDVTPEVTPASADTPLLLGGVEDLEVVGESNYQAALWQIAGGRRLERVRVPVQAVLLPEQDNPYDANAISVWIFGLKIGYLSRADAAVYRSGLLALQTRHGRRIALSGVVVGGGLRSDGPGMLGVWLSHDPRDFGLVPVVPVVPALQQAMRTGLSEAFATDAADDSYDLSWHDELPDDSAAAIKRLRTLLREVSNPLDRHFMYCELERNLYRSRDVFDSALEQYDEACRQHDAEMEVIRTALFTKFGAVPLLETYTQMSIRQQKAKNWAEALWWARRGISLYGADAARPEAVTDLENRVEAYVRKLERASAQPRTARPAAQHRDPEPVMEILVCHRCGRSFERLRTRGRKPTQCDDCR
ncbi:hypothetical protein [Actinoplanes sp. NPDC049316]|uniref:hypothetical protein n=1 Tax=Actinoplanes sp. NPDC049316 TaxID=3154727 RepID=UPI0034288F76